MKKLLLAVHSQVVSEELRQCLRGRFEIRRCGDGLAAVSCLRDFCPDVMVIDLMLSNLDGITVIKASHSAGIFPKVIALSDYISPYIADALEQLEVSDLLRYPLDMGAAAARILELSANRTVSVQSDIRDIVAVLGFPMGSSGAAITQTALELYMQNPSQPLYKQLYPAVAGLCGGTPDQVERAIRACVESAWKKRNEEIWRLYFAVGKNGRVAKPTNADFLARISGCIHNLSSKKKTG